MADLLSILSSGSASLAAQRAAAATASHNLENVNTPGYARQRAVLEATLPAERVSGAFIGRGARLQTVQQARDRFLEAQLPLASSRSARSGTQAGILEAVHALDPGAPGSVGDALSAFYASLRQLSQNAGDASLRQQAVGSARSLALSLRGTRAGLEEARGGIDARLSAGAGEANRLAATVARLNREIRIARADGAEPNDLLDARQSAVDAAAALTGATPTPSSDGDVYLFLPGGTALVAGDLAASLSTVADPANGGHLALRIALPGGAPAALASSGGELGGLLDARDGALLQAVREVDAIAWDLGGAVNARHAAGFGADGSTGLALFDLGATSDGAAARIDVAAAVVADPRKLAAASSAASLPGDGGNALALVATERQLLSGGLDAAGALARATSAFGAAASGARALADADDAVFGHLTRLRESTSGVSIDEELIEMQKAQRAFEAITKVIQASSEMFDTLMRLKE